MAVAGSTTYYTNAIVGQVMAGTDIDIYRVDAAPKYPVGQGFERADGNRYRYCHFGLLSPVGNVVSPDFFESNLSNSCLSIITLSKETTKPVGETIAPNAPGSKYIQALITATANQFAGGYATIFNTGSGTGFTYRVKGNTATGGIVGTYTHFEIYGVLQSYLDTTSAMVLTGSKYANLEPAIASATAFSNLGLPVGLTVANVSATQYAWVCTRGITGALIGAASAGGVNLGNPVVLNTNTAGALTTGASGVFSKVGVCTYPGTATNFGTIYVQCE